LNGWLLSNLPLAFEIPFLSIDHCLTKPNKSSRKSPTLQHKVRSHFEMAPHSDIDSAANNSDVNVQSTNATFEAEFIVVDQHGVKPTSTNSSSSKGIAVWVMSQVPSP
jgi:hypothetical protein